MQKDSRVLGGAAGLITIAISIIGFAIVRPALAQEEATTTDSTVESLARDSVWSSTSSDASGSPAMPTVEGASTAAVTADPPPPQSPQTVTSADGLVEVQLRCMQSYTGVLYDTPSGHLDAGYFLGSEFASTTGMTVAHEIGQQAWTVCHDARGHEHEFTLTAEEYAALQVRGTPQKSVWESADQAALDSFSNI